jgi:hypothetical protein
LFWLEYRQKRSYTKCGLKKSDIDMLKLTKKADYGLMALKYLAEHPEMPALSAKDVADAYGTAAMRWPGMHERFRPTK